jgi:hypothetical protein
MQKKVFKNSTHLCSSVNLGLPSILTLSKDGGGKELVPVLSTDEIRGLEEDGSAVVPGHAFPLRLCSKRTIDGQRYGGLVGFVVRAQMTRMVVRHGLFRQRPGLDLIRIQDEGSRILRGLAGKRQTSTPFTMQGTSKGSCCSICVMAAANAWRSGDPGAYDFCATLRD